MNSQELARAVRNGDAVIGTAILSPSPTWPGMLKNTGLDFVFIDTEHTPLDRATVSWMCQLYRATNLAPVVRIPAPDAYQACMVLDAGAAGIVAPYIETVDEVRRLAGAVKHRPVKGQRSAEVLYSNDSFEPELSTYLNGANASNLLLINVESVPAIEALDGILDVEGLDGVLIGPHDLTCSLGIPEQYQHPRFIEAVEHILVTARKKNIAAGVHMWDAVGFDRELAWMELGANIILHSSDLLLFRNALQQGIRKIKASIAVK